MFDQGRGRNSCQRNGKKMNRQIDQSATGDRREQNTSSQHSSPDQRINVYQHWDDLNDKFLPGTCQRVTTLVLPRTLNKLQIEKFIRGKNSPQFIPTGCWTLEAPRMCPAVDVYYFQGDDVDAECSFSRVIRKHVSPAYVIIRVSSRKIYEGPCLTSGDRK